MSVLDRIIATKLDEVAALRTREAALLDAANAAGPTRDFTHALRRDDGTLAVIAECKRRSPSKGDLAPDLDPAATAKAYEAGDASALSVLTDADYFGGSLADLAAARDACTIPVLRKDFTIDPLQVVEARGAGADAILLIVAAIPDDAMLTDLRVTAEGWGLGVLVEAHSEPEVERALASGARVVGVNNRNLGDFAEDLSVAHGLAARIPRDVVAVAESAIRSADDAARMADAGFDAVLVGEALVRSDDPAAMVRAMRAYPVAMLGRDRRS
jgi:indole-3-glycerol phosphate synthase